MTRCRHQVHPSAGRVPARSPGPGRSASTGPALPSCLSLFALLRLFIERIRQTTRPCFGRVIVLALSAQMFSHNHPRQRSRAAEVNRMIPNNPVWRNGLLPSRQLNHIILGCHSGNSREVKKIKKDFAFSHFLKHFRINKIFYILVSCPLLLNGTLSGIQKLIQNTCSQTKTCTFLLFSYIFKHWMFI